MEEPETHFKPGEAGTLFVCVTAVLMGVWYMAKRIERNNRASSIEQNNRVI